MALTILYHFDHKFTGCYALPHELAQSVVHGLPWCGTEIILSSLVQVHDSFWPRSRLSSHISAATVTLGLLYVSLHVCRQCHMQSDSSTMVEIFFEIGTLCCHKFIANLWPLRSRNRFSSLSNVTRHWTYGRNGTVVTKEPCAWQAVPELSVPNAEIAFLGTGAWVESQNLRARGFSSHFTGCF